MLRQVWEDGVPRQLMPDDIQRTHDVMLVMLARYLHQSISELEQRPMDVLHRWYDVLVELFKAQSAQKDDNTD